jgi:putative FmdB family regulatory protein
VPLYEYKCLSCGRLMERIEKVSGPHLKKCPHCGGKVEQVLAAPAIQFKGAGWYVTDYAKKTSGGDSGKAAGGSTETVSKVGDSKESGSTETKEKKSTKKK